jgi:signal transduction histidine kinase
MVQAVTANRELQRSRERLVSAREEERRRVRRDLHDGLGPSLATMAMKLEAARDLIAADPEGAEQLVGQLYEQTRSDIVEIRRLVEGLRPPALDQLGLVSALRQRASDHNRTASMVAGDTPMRWTVQADEDVEPLPAAVEVAAYRIVLESVNNALRHGHASACTVTLSRRSGALEVEVRDDGVGLDGRREVDSPSDRGVGLESMQERAEELGGTYMVVSSPRHGTRIIAILPLTEWTDDDESARS